MNSRQQCQAAIGRCIRLRDFELDLDRRELRAADGAQAPLRNKALEALLVLAEHAGHVVSKDEMMARVWPGVVVTEDSLTQLVNRIRRQLGDTDRSLLRTVSRRGYVLAVDRDSVAGAAPNRVNPRPAIATNLPTAAAPLFGRESDLGAVAELVRQQRLVTISGAGGIGKTALALAVARGAAADFEHGVWWVDLAMLADPAQVLPAVAAALGIELTRGDALRRLVSELSDRHLLLVLDNCEHLVAEVVGIVEALIDAAARVKVLATSQEPLKTATEQLYRLDALALPPQGASLALAAGFGAFQLFERRAIASRQDFALNEENVALAIDICRSLDGVPLAIEMAAARACTLGVAGVHARLGHRLRLLRSARRTAPARQQTLRATLDWSCSLLNEQELAALRRLSVFAGPFDMELATHVVSEGADDGGAVDAVCSLADKSLVRVEQLEPARFRLLESTRLLAREMLADAGEGESALRRHAEAMASIGPRIAEAFFLSGSDTDVQDRFAAWYADLERALDHACAVADADSAAAILVGLRSMDQLRGEMQSMQGRLEKCLRILPPQISVARARILTVVASCGWLSLEGFSAREAAAAAVQAWRALGAEPRSLVHAVLLFAAHAAREGACLEAQAALSEARLLTQQIAHPKAQLIEAFHAGHVAMFCGDMDLHLRRMTDALALARRLGASRAACYIQSFLPGAALLAGDVPLAISLGSQAALELREPYQRRYLAAALVDLVRALAEAGELDRSCHEAIKAVPLAWEYGFQTELARHMALLALRLDRAADAATLLGYATSQRAAPRNALEIRCRTDCDALRQMAECSLGPSLARAALDAGGRLDDSTAFALAISIADSGSSSDPASATKSSDA